MNFCMGSTHSNSITLDWNDPHRYLWPVYGFRTVEKHKPSLHINDSLLASVEHLLASLTGSKIPYILPETSQCHTAKLNQH